MDGCDTESMLAFPIPRSVHVSPNRILASHFLPLRRWTEGIQRTTDCDYIPQHRLGVAAMATEVTLIGQVSDANHANGELWLHGRPTTESCVWTVRLPIAVKAPVRLFSKRFRARMQVVDPEGLRV